MTRSGTTAALTAALGLCLAGCAVQEAKLLPGTDSGTGSPGVSSAPETVEPEPPATTGPPDSAEDGTDLSACADGECQVEVTSGDVLEFDDNSAPDLYIESVESGTVSMAVHYSDGGGGYISTGEGGTASFNDLVIRIESVDDSTAIITVGV